MSDGVAIAANRNGSGRIRIVVTIRGNGVCDDWETGIRFNDKQSVEAIRKDLDEALITIRAKAQEYIR